MSTDGLLRIEGRKRDVFNTPEGSNIHPERTELMLEALPWVHAAMLVGDERPCMVAFLVLASPPMKVPGGNGYLDSQQFEDEYTKARQAIRDVNKGLESMECIRDVALFCSTFSPQTYRSVGSGKVRRDRKEFLKRYEEIISRTYDNLQP